MASSSAAVRIAFFRFWDVRGSGTADPSRHVAFFTPIRGVHPALSLIASNKPSSSPGATWNACSNRRVRANAFRSLAPENPSCRFRLWSRNWSFEHIHASFSLAYSMMVRSSLLRPSVPSPRATRRTAPASTRSMSSVLTQVPLPRYRTFSALRVALPPPSQIVWRPPTAYSFGRKATTSKPRAFHGSCSRARTMPAESGNCLHLNRDRTEVPMDHAMLAPSRTMRVCLALDDEAAAASSDASADDESPFAFSPANCRPAASRTSSHSKISARSAAQGAGYVPWGVTRSSSLRTCRPEFFRRDPALLGCARHRGAGRGLGLEPPGATAGDAKGCAIHVAASDDDAMCFRRRPGRARWSGSLRRSHES